MTEADENEMENNLECLRVEVFATHMKSRGGHCLPVVEGVAQVEGARLGQLTYLVVQIKSRYTNAGPAWGQG